MRADVETTRVHGPVTEAEIRLAREVRAIACEVGIDVVGFGDVHEATPPGFRHLPVGISLGVVHPAVRDIARRRETECGDAAGREVLREELEASDIYDHRDLDGQSRLEEALGRIARYLRRGGYRYFCCPAEVDPMDSPFTALMIRRFSHKAAATCAGLGSVGRHGLLNHPDYGPFVSWATLLTNAPLPLEASVDASDCGECRACVDACPSGAISGRSWHRAQGMQPLVDTERCRRSLDEREARTGLRICGRCALTCVLTRLA